MRNSGPVPTLIAEPGAGQSMTQAARDALRKVDSVLSENSEPLKKTIANFKTFTDGFARNTGKIDSILAGLDKTMGGGTPAQKITYDLRAPQNLGPAAKTLKGQLALPEPTAVAMLETQRFLFSPAKDYPGFADCDLGRRDSEIAAGQADREFRELRYRPRAAAVGRPRAGRLPASRSMSGASGS